MTELPVQCESCGAMSRVPAQAVGMMAICPSCRREFVVRGAAQVREIPTVYPVDRTPPARSVLFGLAISAFLIPLAWLLAKALGAPPPVFTLMMPLALAIAVTGLGVGIALAGDWSFGLRVKLILGMLFLGWCLGAGFYIVKAEWVEAMRRNFGFSAGKWYDFSGPQGLYRVQMPGRPRPDDVEMVRGWVLETFRYADRNDQSVVYAVGSGRPAPAQTEDKFFAAAKEAASAAANGTLISEKNLVLQKRPGREFVFKLGDQATNRTVRVYLVGRIAVVAMVEGAFLPADAREVRKFFDSLDLKAGR